MKNTTISLILSCFITVLSYSQSSTWTAEHITVLEKYGLTQDDNRGIILYFSNVSDCTIEKNSIKEGLEVFLTTGVRKDLTNICIVNSDEDKSLAGLTLDIYQIIDLYLQVSKEK